MPLGQGGSQVHLVAEAKWFYLVSVVKEVGQAQASKEVLTVNATKLNTALRISKASSINHGKWGLGLKMCILFTSSLS